MDCGLYVIKAMEWYDGRNEKEKRFDDLSRVGNRNFQRCKIVFRLANHKENEMKEKMRQACVAWSSKKPKLLERQKIRKAKEKHLSILEKKKAN